MAGGLLAGLWVVEGPVGATPPAGYFSNLADLLDDLVGSLSSAIFGAVVGGVFGFLEGTVLAFPLASALGRFRDGGDAGGAAEPVRPSGAV